MYFVYIELEGLVITLSAVEPRPLHDRELGSNRNQFEEKICNVWSYNLPAETIWSNSVFKSPLSLSCSSSSSCCVSAPGQGPQGATGLPGSRGHWGQAAPHLQKHQLQTAGGQHAGPSLQPRCKNSAHTHTHTQSQTGHTGSAQSLLPDPGEQQIGIQEIPLSQVNKHFQYKLVNLVWAGVWFQCHRSKFQTGW